MLRRCGLIEERTSRAARSRARTATGEGAGLAVELGGRRRRASRRRRSQGEPRTRSRSSAVALLVKVMARTCSGVVTESSASSLRKRWMSRPVLPEPAGASTMKERRMSRACGAGVGVGRPWSCRLQGLRRGVASESGEEGQDFSQARPPLKPSNGVGLVFGRGLRARRLEGGGVEAAEQALLAVLAGLRVALGRDAGVAGVEVSASEVRMRATRRPARRGCESSASRPWAGCRAGPRSRRGPYVAGANAGEGDGGEVRLAGDDGVERKLRRVGALAEPVVGVGGAGLVVEDDLAGGFAARSSVVCRRGRRGCRGGAGRWGRR